PVADLRALADEDAVVRQHLADREGVLRLERCDLSHRGRARLLEGAQLRLARVARAVVLPHSPHEVGEPLLRVANDAEVRLAVTPDLCRVDVELDEALPVGHRTLD